MCCAGQVVAQKGAMISLSFHQQDHLGRDVLVGYVAVPLQRVVESGREEGWYDLRAQNDSVVQSKAGIAEILVSIAVSAAPGVPSTPSQQDELSPEIAIPQPKGLLEVFIGRTMNIDGDGIARKLACMVRYGAHARKTKGMSPKPNATWDQGFQIGIHSPVSDSIEIEVVDDPVDEIDAMGRPIQLGRYFGSCSLRISQIIQELQENDKGFVSGWYELHEGTSDAAPNSSRGPPAILIAFAYLPPPPGPAEVTSGWLRRRDQQDSLYFVLEPYSQVIFRFSS